MRLLRHARLVAILLLSMQSFALARGAAAAEAVAMCACCHTDLAHCHCGMHPRHAAEVGTHNSYRPRCVLPHRPALTMLLYMGLAEQRPVAPARFGSEFSAAISPLPSAPLCEKEKPPPRFAA